MYDGVYRRSKEHQHNPHHHHHHKHKLRSDFSHKKVFKFSDLFKNNKKYKIDKKIHPDVICAQVASTWF